MNRRKFPRANYKCVISIKSDEPIHRVISTHTENIGIGGICVIIKENIDLFENVQLELLLDDSNLPIRCAGSIVWVIKRTDPKNKAALTYDTGIEFLNINEADKNRIGDIVEKILPPHNGS